MLFLQNIGYLLITLFNCLSLLSDVFLCYIDNCLSFLDGDRKAYYESSQWTMKKNKETIADLAKTNKELRRELANKEAVSLRFAL